MIDICRVFGRGDHPGQYVIITDPVGTAYWKNGKWVDILSNPMCSCDACSSPAKSPYPTTASIEGNIMDMERRIKYDDKEGCWRVIFNGKVTTDKLKTSTEAYQLMSEFTRKAKEPKY